jgi:hypothetical protein
MTVAYVVIAVACLAAPFATASPRMASALFPYTAGPMAYVTVALGCQAYWRPGRASLEVMIASLWGAGAIALSVNVSAPPLSFEQVLRASRAQMLLCGVAGGAALLAAARALLQHGRSTWMLLQLGALLAIAILLARRSLVGLAVLPSSGGIEAISTELGVGQAVLVGCGTLVLLAAVASRPTRAH